MVVMTILYIVFAVRIESEISFTERAGTALVATCGCRSV